MSFTCTLTYSKVIASTIKEVKHVLFFTHFHQPRITQRPKFVCDLVLKNDVNNIKQVPNFFGNLVIKNTLINQSTSPEINLIVIKNIQILGIEV